MQENKSKNLDGREFLKISGLSTLGILTGVRRIEASISSADLVLMNGKIITVNPKSSVVQAVAVKRGEILEVGESEFIFKFIGRETKVINLKGKTVTPGPIDSHAHLPFFGLCENGWLLKLQGVFSKYEILELLAQRARKTPSHRSESVVIWDDC